MSETTTLPHSSDNFWKKRPLGYGSTHLLTRHKKAEHAPKDYLSSIDESPEFYDPYSELNLFLSQQIKGEIQNAAGIKKWSLKIQEELIQKIAPEFQKKFPQYRLGIAALKKVWEKISYYSQQIQQQKEAINKEGQLNIHFLIRENLKSYFNHKTSSALQPFHYAHQLAMKMSECIATIDGIRPKIDQMTKLIWGIQRHLIVGGHPETHKSPYDEYDKMDRLIVKTLLEIIARQPQITSEDLETKAREALHALHELPSFASTELMTANVSALLAENQYQTTTFHTSFLSEQKNALLAFVKRHTSLCRISHPLPTLSDCVRRVIALYTLASQLPKNLQEEDIHAAISSGGSPKLPQSLYAFIAAEQLLINADEREHTSEEMAKAIWATYQEAILLPVFQGKDHSVLEIVIWKSISEMEGILEKLPYRIGQRIEEEIAFFLIDHPTQSFTAIVQAAVNFFKNAKEVVLLKKWSEIERKIHLWAVQGDMLCRWIRLDHDNILLKAIIQKFKDPKITAYSIDHALFMSEIAQSHLKKHPELTPYAGQLACRISILYKYAWYALFAKQEESSYDRFIKWHLRCLQNRPFDSTPAHLLMQLEEIVKRTLPLIPFDQSHAAKLLAASQQQPASEQKKRDTEHLSHG